MNSKETECGDMAWNRLSLLKTIMNLRVS